jgi:hypothetical protein
MATPGAITLGELKALGAFVRQQDLDARVCELVARDRVPHAFPLEPTRAPADATIDLFDGERWRRVPFTSFDGERIVWRDGQEDHAWTFERNHVAPAGRYTAWQGDASRAREATLREDFRPVRRNEVVRDAAVERVEGAYVTFRVRSFDPNARWVDHLTQGSYNLHVADPRVDVPGVRSLPDSHHAPIAVSHRWLTRAHPDPQGAQFAEFIAACERLQLHDAQTFLIDWCALPQRPRTPREAAVFRRELPIFQAHFGRQVMVLNEGAEDYRHRGWCMLELMAASVSGRVLAVDGMSSALADAYRLAQDYVKLDRFHWDNIRRGRGHAAVFVRDPVNVAIHNARIDRHREIVAMFENEMRVTEARDVPVIVRLLKELVFGERAARPQATTTGRTTRPRR